MLGTGAAWALTRVLRDILFEISATDPGTYAAAAVLCLLIALGACAAPALRATRVDPLSVLRSD